MSEIIDEIAFPLPFSRIYRAKAILARIWRRKKKEQMECRRMSSPSEKMFDSYPTFTIETKSYTAILSRAEDWCDGSSWFEFSLRHNGRHVFQNTNWRSSEHFYNDAKDVLRHAKAFERECETSLGENLVWRRD